MPSPAPSELPLEVSCQLIGAIFDLCEDLDIDADAVCAGLPYDLAHFRDPKRWIDWHTLAQLAAKLGAHTHLSNEEIGVAAGRLLDRGAMRPILALASLIVSPATHTRWFFAPQGMIHKFYRVFETSFSEHPDGRGFEWTIELTPPDYPSIPTLFWTIQGQAEALFRRLGARDAHVELSLTPRGARFVTRYETRSLALRVRDLLGWPRRIIQAQRMIRQTNSELLDRLAALEAEVRRRERAEEQLRLQMAEAEALQQQLDRSERLNSLGLVAGGVAHDFNNLLTGIMGYAELALDSTIDAEELTLYLEGITEAAERATELTRQLLTFGRQQATKTRRATLDGVVSETWQMLRRLLPAHIEAELELDPDPASAPQLLLDRGQVEQVIMNLALNARDAMPEGGRLSVRVGAVELLPADLIPNPHDLRPGRFATLEVRDTGEGIAPEDIARIFDPFFTTKPEGEGTGLGLSVVFGVVRRHEGMIEVRSELGRGTQFLVYLPEASSDALTSASEQAQRGPGPRGRAQLLLVDDDPLVRAVASRLLTNAGYAIELAADGDEALALITAAPGRFELVFSDLVMPRRSGLSLVRELRRSWPALPVLVATGYARHPEALAEIAELSVPLLRKPYVRDELLWAIHDALVAT